MKVKAILACLLAAGFLAATDANAATVSFTNSFSGPTDVTNQLITLSQFDSNLGTLDSVSVALQDSMTTTLTVSGGSTNTGRVLWDKDIYTTTLTGDTAYNNLVVTSNMSGTRVYGPGAYGTTVSGSALAVIPGQSIAGPTLAVSNTFTLFSGLLPFEGTGVLSFFLSTSNLDTVTVYSFASQSMSTLVNGTASITYSYTPAAVPLPAAALLFGSGLTGLLGFARRQKKAA